MRKSTLFLFVSLIALTQINAQVSQGTILVGGTAGFSMSSSEDTFDDGTTSTTTEGPKETSFEIMPWAGYMITDDFGAGLGIGFASATSESTYIDFFGDEHTVTDKTSMFVVAPGVRYYYVHMDMTHLWAQLSIPIGSGKFTSEDEVGGTSVSTESKISILGAGITPGVTINIGEICGLEASYGFLGYTSSKVTTESGQTTTTYEDSGFGLEWAETFTFGIIFQL